MAELGRDSTTHARQFPTEDFVNGFKDQYKSQSLSPIQIEAYSLAAGRIAANAFRRGDSRHLIPCTPRATDDALCRAQFIREFGRRAFRRPLEPEEVARFEALFQSQGDCLKGAQTIIEAVLQSPSFLLWMEQTPKPEWRPYATAGPLAYSLWDTMPAGPFL